MGAPNLIRNILLPRVLGGGALLGAFWMSNESRKREMARVQQFNAGNYWEIEKDLWENSRKIYTNNGQMDAAANQLYARTRHIKLFLKNMVNYANGWFNVAADNLVPLSIGLAGGAYAFRREVGTVGGWVRDGLRAAHADRILGSLARGTVDLIGATVRGSARVVGGGVNLLLDGARHAPASFALGLGALAVGVAMWNQFRNSWTGEGTREFFKNELINMPPRF